MNIRKQKNIEMVVKLLLGACAFLSILTTFGIIFVLSKESFEFFSKVPVLDFLFGTRWEPLLEPKSFGVLPLVSGTLMIMFGSGVIAIPVGLLSAVYLSEYSSFRTRSLL